MIKEIKSGKFNRALEFSSELQERRSMSSNPYSKSMKSQGLQQLEEESINYKPK